MYTQLNSEQILRLSDGAIIPTDPENRDYAEFLVWKANGGILS
jgi:hypothetical protein